MGDLVGIVSRPQFDMGIFKPGKAIHVRHTARNNEYKLKDTDGLIGRVTPLAIIIWLYVEKDHDCDYIEIPIESVVSGEYELTFMWEDKK